MVLPFPFSDLTSSKRRPALILAKSGANDFVLSQITSKSVGDNYAVEIGAADFDNGGLNVTSNIRPNKLFTAEASIIAYKAGSVNTEKTDAVVAAINRLLENGG
ncbi:MAG: type II toxin-antitoxin system PemK/MazF family toxin [Clostridiales Family XIII bacterium]|nr:type II toxin-antitoxin system PemK/MazF family toxin [Clostridiales Family XIII bacterium]